PVDNQRLVNLCGPVNQHLSQIEDFYNVKINCRSNQFEVSGEGRLLKTVKSAIQTLYNVAGHEALSPATVQLYLNDNVTDESVHSVTVETDADEADNFNRKRHGKISGRGKSQQQYLEQIKSSDLTLGVGPAGTGKTYLAVACAVEALENDLVDRLILVRPAVEAGERLGFLPGDLAQKIDPYLRPMYDALFEMMGQQKVAKCIERNIIEIAPLAYMRGRTLNDSFIILDEAQNTTIDQMKMFLTRIGFGSKAVITGDITQVDLPREKTSGLRHALKILSDIEGIGITQFHKGDIVRHPLVKKIVHAYEEDESK
ncbi:MAG: PhoH family protein, partial [Gammaproteobacteria bacterium]|nr:PhoH family protein [Gammaproteobacteria bacterium]